MIFKRIKGTDKDKEALTYMKQKIFINERQLVYGCIDEDEYKEVLADIDRQLKELEIKYNLVKEDKDE